jgi:phosphoribosyl-dephospho-CoA transferase
MPEATGGGRHTEPWRRHDLLHVVPGAWTAALAAQSLGGVPFLADWADRGWPVIVRRRMTSEDPEVVPVGVPLPPSVGKLRVAVQVPQAAVVARAAPTSLRMVADKAAPAWQPTIAALLALGERHGVEPAAFGSLLWEHHTGLNYLSPTSDLDLIWPASGCDDLPGLLDGLARLECTAPMRIDGEVVFPQGTAANWRELHKALGDAAAGEILIKSMDGVHVVNVRCLPGCERMQ